jgi:hypothetical protein
MWESYFIELREETLSVIVHIYICTHTRFTYSSNKFYKRGNHKGVNKKIRI